MSVANGLVSSREVLLLERLLRDQRQHNAHHDGIGSSRLCIWDDRPWRCNGVPEIVVPWPEPIEPASSTSPDPNIRTALQHIPRRDGKMFVESLAAGPLFLFSGCRRQTQPFIDWAKPIPHLSTSAPIELTEQIIT